MRCVLLRTSVSKNLSPNIDGPYFDRTVMQPGTTRAISINSSFASAADETPSSTPWLMPETPCAGTQTILDGSGVEQEGFATLTELRGLAVPLL